MMLECNLDIIGETLDNDQLRGEHFILEENFHFILSRGSRFASELYSTAGGYCLITTPSFVQKKKTFHMLR